MCNFKNQNDTSSYHDGHRQEKKKGLYNYFPFAKLTHDKFLYLIVERLPLFYIILYRIRVHGTQVLCKKASAVRNLVNIHIYKCVHMH